MTFTPSRLILARKRRGLTQKDLADAISMTARSVIMYENGEQTPPEATVKKLSEVLHFPVDFFSLDEVEQVPANEISFRAFSRLTAKQKD